jgi:hypothetical protein
LPRKSVRRFIPAAMAELAQQWLAGNLGSDLYAVVEYAVRTVLR